MNMNHQNNLKVNNEYPVYNGDLGLHEILHKGMKRKAAAIDFYTRLVDYAPNQSHCDDILQILEDEKAHFHQLDHLYRTITGHQVNVQIDPIPFQTYQEGLKIGYKEKIKQYQGDRNTCYSAHNSQVGDVLLYICLDEIEHAKRLEMLKYSIDGRQLQLRDYGPNPFVVNINEVTKENHNFRTALWTGQHLQVTLMSIGVGEDIGLEIHPNLDQFLRIEQGQGIVQMGPRKNQLNYRKTVRDDFAIMVPAGTWHNVINTGNIPLKLYSIYAPPQHPKGTVHKTKSDAMAAEAHHHHR
ncbi:cupin domain-containing protein [Bacillus sp. DNRA2]|uniref:cupin domain-containing protein n=1 Tax=Bacillus sp. DNRA2 TaxID=2723053 RepID=UPI002006E9BB|nr:cupin domain-containing protein [Bacillus sp. DNRA2]